MAYVRTGNRTAPCSVIWSIDGDLKPGATCRMISGMKETVELVLDPDEFARLWASLARDPRFQIDKRGAKSNRPDPAFSDMVNDLLNEANKRK